MKRLPSNGRLRAAIQRDRVLASLREAGADGDYARARRIMQRHAAKLPRHRMKAEWAEAYRNAMEGKA